MWEIVAKYSNTLKLKNEQKKKNKSLLSDDFNNRGTE